MSAIFPDEGRHLILQAFLKRSFGVDRDSDLEIGLLTNTVITTALTHAAVTEPSGGGYGRISVVDADWSVIADLATRAAVQFLAGGGGWVQAVQGYFIATKASGGTKRLLFAEMFRQQQLAVAALNWFGGVVTCDTPLAHGLNTSDYVNVRGANQAGYNGIFQVTVITPLQFTYNVVTNPGAITATGTIKVNQAFLMADGSTLDVTPTMNLLQG